MLMMAVIGDVRKLFVSRPRRFALSSSRIIHYSLLGEERLKVKMTGARVLLML